MSLIEIKKACVTYNEGSSNQVDALIDIDMEIENNEYVIIFGPSGCGKSTLLNLIAGLEKPTDGEVIIDGKNIGAMNSDQFARFHCTKIGMVFQAYNLLSSLSVRDNIILPQMFLGETNRKLRREHAEVLLKKFGIVDQADRIPTQLSGGQQQRIGIARALINNQPIILADEPIGNLDSKSAQNVMEILKELNEKDKKTIIMVTHNPENLDYAHRVFYMKDGRIEHVVVNKKHPDHKKDISPQEKEIDLLMRSFPGFSEAQLQMLITPFKAKVLAEYLLTNTDVDQNQRLEELIRSRILGKSQGYEFRMMLDRPLEKGGVGLDERTAAKYSKEVDTILENAGLLQKNLDGIARRLNISDAGLKAKLFTRYLARAFDINLNDEQKTRFEKTIHDRITNHAGRELFLQNLDKPTKQGGVGLDKRVARKVIRELETTLLVKFGLTKK